jgi:hypothetical protein
MEDVDLLAEAEKIAAANPTDDLSVSFRLATSAVVQDNGKCLELAVKLILKFA